MKSSLADRARFISEAMMANMVASAPGGAVRAMSTSMGTMASWPSGAEMVVSMNAKVRGLSPSHSLTP